MPNYRKIIGAILSGKSDMNIGFNDLYSLLLYLGFEVRINGSHHVFRKSGIPMLINIQKDGNKAKSYQIKQIRNVLIEYNLTELPNG